MQAKSKIRWQINYAQNSWLLCWVRSVNWLQTRCRTKTKEQIAAGSNSSEYNINFSYSSSSELRAPRQLLQLAGKRQPHYQVEPEKHIFAFISRQKLCQTHLLAPTSHHHIAVSAPCPPATPLPSCCPSWLLGPLFIADFAAQLVCQSFDKVSNCVCGSKSNREMEREGVAQTVLPYRVYSSQVFSTLTQLSGTTSWKSHTLPATNLIISFSW